MIGWFELKSTCFYADSLLVFIHLDPLLCPINLVLFDLVPVLVDLDPWSHDHNPVGGEHCPVGCHGAAVNAADFKLF